MVEVLSDAVKAGLIAELTKSFPGVSVYDEQIVRPAFPHFFVLQMTQEQREERKGYWWLSYLVNLRYRDAAEPFAQRSLEAKLDNVSMQLMELNNIYLADMPIRIRNARTEKVEGVLHYFCNFLFQVNKPEAERIKQLHLETQLRLKTQGG